MKKLGDACTLTGAEKATLGTLDLGDSSVHLFQVPLGVRRSTWESGASELLSRASGPFRHWAVPLNRFKPVWAGGKGQVPLLPHI